MSKAPYTQLTKAFEAMGGEIVHRRRLGSTKCLPVARLVYINRKQLLSLAKEAEIREHTVYLAALSHEIGHCLAYMLGMNPKDEKLAWLLGEAFYMHVTGEKWLPIGWHGVSYDCTNSYRLDFEFTGDYKRARRLVKKAIARETLS